MVLLTSTTSAGQLHRRIEIGWCSKGAVGARTEAIVTLADLFPKIVTESAGQAEIEATRAGRRRRKNM